MLRILNKTNSLYSKILTNEIRSVSSKTITQRIYDDEQLKIKKKNRRILENHLGLSVNQSFKLVTNLKLTCNYRNYNLESTVKKLIKLGIKKEDIIKNPQCLNFTHYMLENNVCYLKEAGCKNIDATTLLNFRTVIKKPINLLKLHGLISNRINVIKKLCSYLDPNPINSLLFEINEESTLVHIHEIILKSFLVLLGSNIENANRLANTYESVKYKSFELMSEVIDILIKKIGFDNKKILQHLYLLEVHPQSIKNVIKTFPLLGGVAIKDVLYKTPKLISVTVENINEILEYFRIYKVPDEAIQKCFEIFTLSPKTIHCRLQEMEKIPEFRIYMKNSRMLLLLLTQNKAKMRMEILKNNNVKCSSLHILCSPTNVFERYAQEGNDRTNGSDIINYLNMELKRPIQEIRESLSNNPHWYHIPFISVQASYEFLQTQGYTPKDIAKLPVILLYTTEQLKNTLVDVNNKIIETKKSVDKNQTLNLCLYLLEKPYHFSGNGLWGANNFKQLQEK